MTGPAGPAQGLVLFNAGRSRLPRIDFTAPRLFLNAPLEAGALVALDRAQTHYLGTVLRLRPEQSILSFNGRDGEWLATLLGNRSGSSLRIETQTRPQPPTRGVHYCFAPLKHARLDYMVQKAVEMGASVLQPVTTRRTQATRVNEARMRANVVEAAEQCGVLTLADVQPARSFADLVGQWPDDRLMVFCDEEAEVADPVAALRQAGRDAGGAVGLIIGPEGGFDPEERRALLALPRTVRLSLGPRVLRADTAAVAALALVQAVLGDWQDDGG